MAGQGTSTEGATYADLDAAAARPGATIYYRLRQINVDGTASYSPVRVLGFGVASPVVALYSTPASTTATLDLTALLAGPQAVTVLDLTGRTLAHSAKPTCSICAACPWV